VSRLVARPVRLAASIAIVIGLVGLAWYLGSPLFIRTTVNEAFPTTAPSAVVASSAPLPAAAPAAPVILATGTLGYVDELHHGTGVVLVVRAADAVVLRFQSVAITNAPDVHVYLSRETEGRWTGATSLYLGPLKATNGSFNYQVPVDADLSAYKSVVVWCRQFSVLVTWADLH